MESTNTMLKMLQKKKIHGVLPSEFPNLQLLGHVCLTLYDSNCLLCIFLPGYLGFLYWTFHFVGPIVNMTGNLMTS
jgi:hypothetical protein